MNSTLIKATALALLFLTPLQINAQENDSTPEKAGIDNWDNFRERDASVFYFNFCVPEAYVSSIKAKRDSKVFSEVSTYINFDIAKYELFQIFEEELSKKTNKKFVVADPDQEDKTFKAYCPGCMSSSGKYGFDYLPGWMFKKFLQYDSEVPYLIKTTVEIQEKISLKSDLMPNHLKPKCIITITIFDRDKNKIGNYKYVKKDFDKIRVNSSTNKVYDRLLKSEWNLKATAGLSLSDIMSIYVQTLQEMMANTDIIMP